MGAVRLRVTDFDDPMTPRTGRSGQGDQHRCTAVPATLTPWRQHHLAGVKTRPQPDLAPGPGAVYRPQALDRKSPRRAKDWGWP